MNDLADRIRRDREAGTDRWHPCRPECVAIGCAMGCRERIAPGAYPSRTAGTITPPPAPTIIVPVAPGLTAEQTAALSAVLARLVAVLRGECQ